MGVSERTVRVERDGWIMLNARMPKAVPLLIEHKRRYVDEPGFRRLCVAYDEAFDWEPDDPRLERLADDLLDYMVSKAEGEQWSPGEDAAVALSANDQAALDGNLMTNMTDASPAWQRLNRLGAQKLQARIAGIPSHSWPFEA
jgi:hypothetical protein